MLSSLIVSMLGTMAMPSPAVPNGPVKVFVLAGQSNMVGHGVVPAEEKSNGGKGSLEWATQDPSTRRSFQKLRHKDGAWRIREDVWIDYLEQRGRLTVGYGASPERIGPELGFGWVVGDALREPVVLVKVAWGGKSLAVDFRPPSSGGTVGPFYTEVVQRTREAVSGLGSRFPALKDRPVQIVGFGWHQGWNDRINAGYVQEYERNMANFIRDIRKDLNAPNLPFVIAETGMGDDADKNTQAVALRNAQAAVARHSEFKSNVAFVGTRAFWRPKEASPSDQGYHWNGNGETYYRIGDAMGKAMLDLMKGASK